MEKESGKRKLTLQNATSSKDTTVLTRRMDKALSLGKAETFIMETTSTMRGTVMEKCTGQMALSTKVNGKKVFSMERES